MPGHEASFELHDIDKDTALATSYQAMQNLNWPVKFATADTLLGNTAGGWRAGQQITIAVTGQQLTVASESGDNGSDTVNEKNTAAFIKAYQSAEKKMGRKTIAENLQAISILREFTTDNAIEEDQKNTATAEARRVPPAKILMTWLLIAANIGVFVAMLLNGATVFEKAGLNITYIDWGSNFSPLTLSGDWWRLASNIFVHFGVIHLGVNMYCLYMAGRCLEPLTGKVKLAGAYISAGVAGSIISLWWQEGLVNSAGAAPAIFGLYGVLLALLSMGLFPKLTRQPALQSFGIFVVYNVAYGLKSHVDHAGNIGGLLAGLIIGYIYVFALLREREGQRLLWITSLVLVITAGAAYAYLQQNEVPEIQRSRALKEAETLGFKDVEQFNTKLGEVAQMVDEAMAPLQDTALNSAALKVKISQTSFPMLAMATTNLQQMQRYDVPDKMKQKTALLLNYIQWRRKQLDLYNKMGEPGSADNFVPALKQINDSVSALMLQLQQL
ncbi:rhomboid family intramembrane serine protease [Ferruginibacter sp.]